MTTIPICRCGHVPAAHPDGECTKLTWTPDGWARCDCREYVAAAGEQVVLL